MEGVTWLLGAAIVAVFVGVFVAGRNSVNRSTSVTTGVDDPNPADCGTACTQWLKRRQERCLTEKLLAAARSSEAAALGAMLALAAAASALAALAKILFAVFPIAGILVAAAAGALFLTAAYFLGQWTARMEDSAAKNVAFNAAVSQEDLAFSLLFTKCTAQERAQCLASAPPC
jgi:hypothetical protein